MANMANLANMDLTEIKNWDVRDLNKALMAAIMAQQLERGNTGVPVANLAPMTSTTVSTTSTTTSTTTTLTTTTSTTELTEKVLTDRIVYSIEASQLSGQLIAQIMTGSVLIMLEILMIVAYVILINHNKIDYRKRMTFILILICTRMYTFVFLDFIKFILSIYRNCHILHDVLRHIRTGWTFTGCHATATRRL